MTRDNGFAWGDHLPRLESERLVLRWLADGDVPALFEIFGDAGAMRYWSWPAFTREEQARELLDDIRRHFAARTLFQWGIARKSDDAVIGTVTLFQIDHEHRRCEIGFALARSAWGQGLATEAVTRIIRFAFDELGLHRIEADPDPQNLASIRVLERQGFKFEGLLRERYFLNGRAMDAAYYGLLRDDWAGGDLLYTSSRGRA